MANVKLIAVTDYLLGFGGAEELIEFAGRICYRSTGGRGDTGEFIERRIQEGHESILEHASASFLITGISRACSHQLVRHRIASFSQESQRYVEMFDAGFVIPPSVESNPDALDIYTRFLYNAREAYARLRALGIRKEDCRFLLPNATETRLVMTMNFRELRHFFKTRCHKAAQWEIRDVATQMLKIMYDVAPHVFGDLYAEFCADGRDSQAMA